jgi:hypothetical protein
MAKQFSELDDPLREFIARQHIFFVASAPLDGRGHVNLSPKGLDSFRVLGPRTVAYLDLTGSGVETIAHVKENGRLTIMFCAFEGPPRILRLQGTGRVIEPSHADFPSLAKNFPTHIGQRSIITMEVERIADSCGYGVPLYHFEKDRDQLDKYSAHKGEAGLSEYRAEKNRVSIDGLPGVEIK